MLIPISLAVTIELLGVDKPHMMEDVQKYTSKEKTRNMRVAKAGTGSGPVWLAGSFILGKIDFAFPFTVARPFSCTLFAGILMRNCNDDIGFSGTVMRRPKRVSCYRTWFKIIIVLVSRILS